MTTFNLPFIVRRKDMYVLAILYLVGLVLPSLCLLSVLYLEGCLLPKPSSGAHPALPFSLSSPHFLPSLRPGARERETDVRCPSCRLPVWTPAAAGGRAGSLRHVCRQAPRDTRGRCWPNSSGFVSSLESLIGSANSKGCLFAWVNIPLAGEPAGGRLQTQWWQGRGRA